MGLDISVVKNPVFVRDPDGKDWSEDEFYVGVYPSLFPERADGMKSGIYRGEHGHRFRAGSYSGYNRYRLLVSEAMLGASDQVVWDNPEQYRDNPFWLQVNFADNEGTIGPVTSRKLSDAYNDPENRKKFERFLRGNGFTDEEIDWELESWDDWALAFKEAAESNGAVLFH